MQPSHWSASDWLSESVLIACCALLVEEILNTGERSPRMYSTDIGVESRREEAREWRLRYGDGTEAGERETPVSPRVSPLSYLSSESPSLVTFRPGME